jgi:DICT domain-containing protein
VQLLDHVLVLLSGGDPGAAGDNRTSAACPAGSFLNKAFRYTYGFRRGSALVVTDPPAGLTIGELSERTRVAAPTLRTWEVRYGFPRPARLASGHRRYRQQDVELIADVLRQRAAGVSLGAALSRAARRAAEPEPSVYAAVRERHPGLTPLVLRKSAVLALTRAIEDECCARAERGLLCVSFQSERRYRQSEQRWAELARTARHVVVFADFAATSGSGAAPLKVAVPADAPLRREWILVCDAPGYAACLTGWEFPADAAVADSDRRFEVLWTADPQAVRDAATACVQLATVFAPELGWLAADIPADPPPPASEDLRRAAGLLTRMAGYLDQAAVTQSGARVGGRSG